MDTHLATAKPALFETLLSPIRIGDVALKNKLFLAPMGLDLANHDGTISSELVNFYMDIAAGGVGCLILSNATVSRDSILQPKGLKMFTPSHAAALAPFIAAAREKGAVVGLQLQHYGGQGTTTFTRGKALLTPSMVPSKSLQKLDPKYRMVEMTQDDIDMVVQQFAEAAALGAAAGAELIQLQASNGYLLSSFLSKFTNRRQDAYGGSDLARARLLIEVVTAIRQRISRKVAVSVRIGIDDFLGDAGQQPEELQDVIPVLEAAGVDMFEASICIADTFSKMGERTQAMLDFVHRQVAKLTSYASVPVGFAGFVASLAEAERLITDRVADMIGMGRALLADNELILKTIEGRQAEINLCLWDGKCFKDKYNPRYQRVFCCVNPKYLRPV